MQKNRRGRGEGSIYQRANGTWCATISIGYGVNGKRRRRTLFGQSKQAVQEKLQKQAGEIAHLADLDSHQLRLGEYLARWLRDAVQSRVRPTTYDNYQRTVNRVINPHLGGVRLAKLTALHIQGMYAALEREGCSPDQIRLAHAVLHRALKLAVRWRLIPFNMAADIERPRVPKTDITPLTVAQVAALLQAVQGDRLEALYVVAVTTGMRLGEIFGLQWSDVDLKTAAIMVQHSLMELNGKLTLCEPKTHRGRRKIDLPQLTVDALWQHQARMLAEGFGGVRWVFCNASGGPLRRSHFRADEFKPLLARAKVPSIRFHDLRHTSATLLLAQGVHPKVVQERLGHSQISVTLDTYSHVLPTLQREAAGKFDQLLRLTKRVKRRALSRA